MRTSIAKEGTAVLPAPETIYAPKTAAGRRGAKAPSLRRDLSDDFARAEGEDGYERPRRMRFNGLRFRVRGGVPRGVAGRILLGCIVLGGLVGFTGMLWGGRSMLLSSPALVLGSFSSIQTVGNDHLTRPQLLTVFGEDIDRNILTVPLEERRLELERLPWVEHATVMRLMPGKIRVAIVERTPVAFVRQGTQIGLVDRAGVLLDLTPRAVGEDVYSFPVVTGISAKDPLSVRAARMKLFEQFLTELDSGGDKVSRAVSEVDMSSPEDVKALLSSGSGANGSDILVHFGQDNFLARYQRFEQNLPGWKRQYPRLASADMRYARQVVLEMAPGAEVPENGTGAAAGMAAAAKPGTATAKGKGEKPGKAVPPAAHPAAKGRALKASAKAGKR